MAERNDPTTIDEYIAAFPARTQQLLADIRATIRSVAPEATERISYRIPTFDLHAVEVVEFETADPGLQGEMTITITLFDRDGATEVVAVHDRLPPGLRPADNEAGWRSSLGKLARLLEGK